MCSLRLWGKSLVFNGIVCQRYRMREKVKKCDFIDVGRRGAVIRLWRSEVRRTIGYSSQALIKDRSASWEMAEEVIVEQRCSCRATPGSCRCDLPRAESRKGAAARGEGRSLYHDNRGVGRSNLSTFKPTRCRDLSAAERRSARRQRFVVRAGRRCHDRNHPTAFLCSSATLLLCVNKNPYLSLPVLHG